MNENKILDKVWREYKISYWKSCRYKIMNRDDIAGIIGKKYVEELKANGDWKYLYGMKVAVNKRLGKSTLGMCWEDSKIFELNKELFLKGNKKKLVDTTIHEICHILDFYKNGKMGHGKGWKNLMIQYGQKPNKHI